jgi:hypothetical protein
VVSDVLNAVKPVTDTADSFSAGFSDAVTNGLTTKIRSGVYGQTATQNHQGAAFTAGQVTGTATSIAIGVGGPAQLARGAQLAKAGKGLVETGKQALQVGARYGNKARMAGQMGAGRAAAHWMARAGSRQSHGMEMLADGWLKLNRAQRLLRSGKNASKLLAAQFFMGASDALYRWYQGDPCDPLTWWDLLYLLPIAQQIRRSRGLVRKPVPNPRQPGSRLSDMDRKAQEFGFEDYDKMREWEQQHVFEIADAKVQGYDQEEMAKWFQQMAEARQHGVRDIDRALIQLTDEGYVELSKWMNRQLKTPGILGVEAEGKTMDAMRSMITGEVDAFGANRFGSVLNKDELAEAATVPPGVLGGN